MAWITPINWSSVRSSTRELSSNKNGSATFPEIKLGFRNPVALLGGGGNDCKLWAIPNNLVDPFAAWLTGYQVELVSK